MENLEYIYDLSPMQQGMLFHSLYAPKSGVYFEQLSIILDGTLNKRAFKQAWQQVIDRHPILRTEFYWEELDKPLQVVRKKVNLPWKEQDWYEVVNPEQKLKNFLAADREQGFELDQAPLMRCALMQIASQRHYFVWSFHHLLLDGWSIPLLLQEVWAAYRAACRGERLFKPRPRPYKDYIAWLQQQDLVQAEAYWRQALQGFMAPTPLVVDQARLSVEAVGYSEHQVCLSSKTSAALEQLARENRLTTNTVIQGAWALLLSRYSGEEEVLFGATVSGRPAELRGVETMVGLFINTLPVRVNVPLSEPVLPWLSDLQEQQREREQYAYSPLTEIQGWSEVPRGTPLFESLLVYENYPARGESSMTGSDLQITGGGSVEQTNYPLTLVAVLTEEEDGAQLYLRMSYDTSRFVYDTIERMGGHLQALLESIVANPDQPLAHLSLLCEAEKHQLLVEWNDTQADYPKNKCIHQLFEEQVERTPEAIAVVFADQAVTYHELNTRANQLAHYLIAQGVGPDVLVGICIERSIEMVVGLLGILKAGGAYVPLDPEYPNERLQFMLEDANVKVLLTEQKLARTFPQVFPQLNLDQDWPNWPHHSNPVTQVRTDDLAYCIYTSGTTGKPKGVLIPHGGLLNLVFWHQDAFQVTSKERATQLANTAFDASVWEIWPYLAAGATLYLVDSELLSVPAHLQEWLLSKNITIAFLPTPLAEMALSLEWPNKTALRIMLTGGDKLRHFPSPSLPFELVNNYGPTEYSVVTTSGIVRVTKRPVPSIGRPIANTQLYILDRHQMLVPIGVPGELHIGGAGLARGYLNRPQLTSEKFIPNPFRKDTPSGRVGEGESGRLYKTGDLCRYLPDGNIEFLGRIDYQVKIRGFRIELGEIEAILNSQPNVREAVVVVRSEGKRLVAYVVGEVKGEPLAEVLRAALKQKLPDYMIPSAFVSLKAMPLTPNGKIDRRALPAPDYGVDKAQQLLPRTPVERSLAAIWQEVLGLEQVGVTDNFFEVGGDSIISIQIVSRAKEAGIHLTPKELFQHQTIAELASVAKEVQKTDAEQAVVTGTLPLTPIQHWFLEQQWHEPHHFNQSFLLELTSDVNPTWLSEAVRALLTHHDALRLRFFCEGNSWRQEIVAPEPSIPFEVIDLSTLNPTEQVARLEQKANQLQASLNLSQGPFVRVALFQSGTTNRLLIVIHHLAVDGVSWRILLEDLQTAYQKLASGEPIQFPAKTTSFKKWSMLLNGENGTNVVADERDYWAQLSAFYHDQSRLPVDRRLGPNNTASATHISTQLSRAQTQALLNEVSAVYHTQINDLLLTALVLAFQEWTGQPALLLELEGHGREELFEVDLSRTVGWFTTIFPLRLELTTSSLGEAIKRVKEQLRQIPNRGIGYGILRYLSPAAVPEVEAEVSFNYLGQFDQMASGPLIKAFASESSGSSNSPFGLRTHLLDINGMVVEGQLQVHWTYSQNFHRAETIQQLANHFIDALQALIAHCQEPEAGGYTPSDFSRVNLSQDELDDLFAEFCE